MFLGGFWGNTKLYIRTVGIRWDHQMKLILPRSQSGLLADGIILNLNLRHWWSTRLGTWLKYPWLVNVFGFICKNFYSKNSNGCWIYSKKYKSNQSIVTKGNQLKFFHPDTPTGLLIGLVLWTIHRRVFEIVLDSVNFSPKEKKVQKTFEKW